MLQSYSATLSMTELLHRDLITIEVSVKFDCFFEYDTFGRRGHSLKLKKKSGFTVLHELRQHFFTDKNSYTIHYFALDEDTVSSVSVNSFKKRLVNDYLRNSLQGRLVLIGLMISGGFILLWKPQLVVTGELMKTMKRIFNLDMCHSDLTQCNTVILESTQPELSVSGSVPKSNKICFLSEGFNYVSQTFMNMHPQLSEESHLMSEIPLSRYLHVRKLKIL